MNDLILIVSNKGVEGDVGDTMVVNTGMENFTRFKDSVKIKEGPRAVRSFTFQGMVIPGVTADTFSPVTRVHVTKFPYLSAGVLR